MVIVKMIWALIGLNLLALLGAFIAYLALSNDRNVDSLESSWVFVMGGSGLLVILLAAVPLYYSHSTLSLVVSGFFSVLPLLIFLAIWLPGKLKTFKKEDTFAETYYKDKTQRSIAAAIENNDTTLLKKLIIGQDLNIQGTKVWDWPGLNYLQFAVRLRSNGNFFPYNEEANDEAIRILIANGCDPKPAFSEAVKYLSTQMVSELIEAGADPNVGGFVSVSPLLFELIGSNTKDIDMAILLVKKGAHVDVKNVDGFTPLMYAAYNANTKKSRKDTWRFVRYLLEEAQADYQYTTADGQNLASIINDIKLEAASKRMDMHPDFVRVVEWLNEHDVNKGVE